MTTPLINILTRTSNRPLLFAQCRNSIVTQTYQNVRHIVSVDDMVSYNYIKQYQYPESNLVKVNRPIRINRKHMPYNLYCNHLLRLVTDGWVMFLDDDDLFVHSNVLESLVERIKSNPKVNLIIWKIQLESNRIVPNVNFGHRVQPGDISSGCVLFHHSLIRVSWWDSQLASDGRFYQRLYYHPTTEAIWVPQIFTRINKHPGHGLRQDLVDNDSDAE